MLGPVFTQHLPLISKILRGGLFCHFTALRFGGLVVSLWLFSFTAEVKGALPSLVIITIQLFLYFLWI